MTNWLDMDKVVILEQTDGNGNRYLLQFVRDYKTIFSVDEVNIGCGNCLNNIYDKLIKYLETMTKTKNTMTTARLKIKYNGIQLHFGSKFHVTNANMTEEQAQFLLAKHPHGAKLFDILPTVKEKTDKQLTKVELVAKYPDIDSKLTKPNFLKAVEEAKK